MPNLAVARTAPRTILVHLVRGQNMRTPARTRTRVTLKQRHDVTARGQQRIELIHTVNQHTQASVDERKRSLQLFP
jgi:hypothetical protein